MTRMLLYYGGMGAAILFAVNLLVLLVMGIPGPEDFKVSEIIGYSAIVVALTVPIWLGMREYRDKMSEGAISFGKAWLVGVVVTELPAVAFAAYNLLYVNVIDPDFTQTYVEHQLNEARAAMPAEEFQVYETTILQNPVLTNMVFQTAIMYLTVLLIGIGISFLLAFVFAFLLKRKVEGGESASV